MQTSIRIAAAICILLSCLTMRAEGAVFRIDPSIVLSEEYNDNILLRGRDSERIYAYVTRVAPTARIIYTTSFWDWDINYTYFYYYYNYKTGFEQHDQTHLLNLRSRTEIFKDLFFIEVLDTYNRVSRDVTVDYTQQSTSTFQVDQNVFTVNPYVILRPSQTSRIIAGYIFLDRRYLNASIDNTTPNVNHTQNIGYGNTAVDLSSRLTFTTGVRYTHDQNYIANYSEYDIYAGPQYTYAENSSVFVRGGRTWFDFDPKSDANHPRREYWMWDSGVNYRISTINLALVSRRSVAYDPIRVATLADDTSATFTNVMQRSVFTLSGGMRDYRDVLIDQRISVTQYALTTLLHRLTPTTSAIASCMYQDVDYKLPFTGVVKIIVASLRLEHRLSERSTLAFEYRNVNSHSYDIDSYNYYNNRYMIEFRQMF